jgi:hypothetical protein
MVGQVNGFAIDQFAARVWAQPDQPTLTGILSPKGKSSIFSGPL